MTKTEEKLKLFAGISRSELFVLSSANKYFFKLNNEVIIDDTQEPTIELSENKLKEYTDF